MVRCFLAVYPLNNTITNKLIETQREISKFIIGKGIERENFHITISFFGEIEESKLENLKRKIEETASKINRRVIILDGIKLIPDSKFIRVIAIDVLGLEDISKEIEKNVGGDVKPPHLTLFRVKSVKEKNKLIDFCSKFNLNENFEVKDLKLMKSTLTKSGPIYEVLSSFNLL